MDGGEEPDYKGEPTMVDKVVGRDQANWLEIKSLGKEPIRFPQLLPKEAKKALLAEMWYQSRFAIRITLE